MKSGYLITTEHFIPCPTWDSLKALAESSLAAHELIQALKRSEYHVTSSCRRRGLQVAQPDEDGEIEMVEFGGRDFSSREFQVVSRIAKGMSNKLIAREMGIEESTVKVHVRNICSKLNANNRTEVAVWAVNQYGGVETEQEDAA